MDNSMSEMSEEKIIVIPPSGVKKPKEILVSIDRELYYELNFQMNLWTDETKTKMLVCRVKCSYNYEKKGLSVRGKSTKKLLEFGEFIRDRMREVRDYIHPKLEQSPDIDLLVADNTPPKSMQQRRVRAIDSDDDMPLIKSPPMMRPQETSIQVPNPYATPAIQQRQMNPSPYFNLPYQQQLQQYQQYQQMPQYQQNMSQQPNAMQYSRPAVESISIASHTSILSNMQKEADKRLETNRLQVQRSQQKK